MSSDIGSLPSRIGRYEILGAIGSGSFAEVVRAWDEGLASHVAIKILNADSNADDLVRERFIEEGQLLRRVHSPAVITVHDVGELDDGRPYLVVDLAEGGTLDERIDQNLGYRVEPDTLKRIVAAMAAGMEAMHDAGVVHRDIKPENLLIDTSRKAVADDGATVMTSGLLGPDERLLITDLGLAKDVTARGAAPSVIGGSARYQAPEQLRADGDLGPPTDIYAASAVLWLLLSGTVAPEPHDISAELAQFRPGWQAFFARAMAMDPADRFPTAKAWHSALVDQLDTEPDAVTDVHANAGGSELATRLHTRSCPYKGLASFQPEDAEVFFGREDLVEELTHRLQSKRVLIVAGPSGSGKSSLVRAGLLPALRNGGLPGSSHWHYELFTPGPDPFDELHYRLTSPLDRAARISVSDLRDDPRQARRLLDDLARTGHADTGGDARLLYIDQFEELFTHAGDPDVAGAFVEALASMVDPTDSKLRLVIAVRADFYGRCAQIAWLANRITENQVLVGPMTSESLRRAIEEPAHRAGLRLEPGLVDTVLDQAGGGAGSLPLVSHALVETWTRRRGNVLTLEGFHAAGGVAGAIAQSGDALLDEKLDDHQREAARRLFLRLITPGDGTSDTRRRLPLAELERDTEPELIAGVVDEFVAARLLSVDDSAVEIAHEALIGGWPRLRDWIDVERENLRYRHRITRAATEWYENDRDVDLGWRGTPLATAVEWMETNRASLDLLEQEFIDSSEAARVEADAAQARRAQRSQRTKRRATVALAVLTLASLLASVGAFVAFRRASDNAADAERQFANALGTSALGQAQSDPSQALLLATESIERSDSATVDARAAVIQARQTLATQGVTPLGPAIVTPGSFKVALRPDGLLAAVADQTGPIRLYDTRTGEQVGADLVGHTTGSRTLGFTADGATLVSGSSDQTVLRWDLSEPETVPAPVVLADRGQIVWTVAIHPDDRHVAVGYDDGQVRIYEIATGTETDIYEWDDGFGITVAAFSPDGRQLVASNRDGRLIAWDTETGDRQWDPSSTPEGPKLWEIIFSPDGGRFATAGDRDVALLHDAATGLAVDGVTFGDPTDPGTVATSTRGIAFSDNGDRVIGGSAAGRIHVWNIDDPGAEAIVTSAGHSDQVEDGAISADGSIYVSVGDDKRLRVWRTAPEPVAITFDGVGAEAYGAAFDPTGTMVAVGDSEGRVHLLDLATESTALVSDPGHVGNVFDVAWSPDGEFIATIGDDGQVLLWEPTLDPSTQLSPPTRLGQHTGAGRSLAFSPDGRFLVSTDRGDQGGIGANVFVWSIDGRAFQAELDPHAQGIRASAFSPDGELLATADGRGVIRLWSTDDFEFIREWEAAEQINPVWALSFNDQGLLASVDSSEDFRVWDPTSRAQIGRTVSGLGTNGATGVGFDASGLTAAIVTRAGEVHLVDWQQGVELTSTTFNANVDPEAESWDLAVAPDGQRFVTTASDGTVRVWDLLSPDRACELAYYRLEPSFQTDLFGGSEPIACL